MSPGQSRSTGEKFRGRAPGSPPAAAGEIPDLPDAGDDDQDGAVPPRVRTSKVRGTYDMWPGQYRTFGRWCDDTAEELGILRVDKQVVVGMLLHLLATDETTARKVKAELRRHTT